MEEQPSFLSLKNGLITPRLQPFQMESYYGAEYIYQCI